jgi:hypothetical protein
MTFSPARPISRMPMRPTLRTTLAIGQQPIIKNRRKTSSAIIPFFGDTLVQQKIDEGFQPYQDAGFDQNFDQIAPGTSDTVQLFEREGRLFAFGVVSQAVLELLMARYTGIDWNNMEVAVPPKGDASRRSRCRPPSLRSPSKTPWICASTRRPLAIRARPAAALRSRGRTRPRCRAIF